MTGLRVGHTEFPLRVWVPLILRLSAHCQWLCTSDCAAEAAGALPTETAKGSLNANSSLLNVLIQCSEVSGMGAETRKEVYRTGRASRLEELAGRMLDAARVWPVPRGLPTSLVRLRVPPVRLSAGSDMDSQLCAKGRENGLDTRPPDGALA